MPETPLIPLIRLIRRGQLRDLTVITTYNIQMALETEQKKLDPYVVTAGVRAALQDENKGIYFVAEIDGRVVGQLMITHEWYDWRNGDIGWIQSVYVHPEFRKQGVFKALHTHTRDAAIKAGAVMIRLYVERENTRAQDVYTNLGMSLPGYLVMEQSLPRE
jgi:ribosomal protein S18 acetylase RimI-like enzyme